MANVSATRMTALNGAVEITIWYNDANLRISNVEWTVTQPGIAVRVRIWDSNVSEVTPVIDRSEGQGSGSENIPGNYRMIEETDPDIGTYITLPPNLTYTFQSRTI